MVLLVFRITSLRENLRSREEEIKELQAENLRLNNLSMTDTLTGLMNRRAIESCILNAIHRHNRFHSEVSIMVLDLDHFKRINDCRGHDFGDKVLKIVADTIKGICRKTDYFAALGGRGILNPGIRDIRCQRPDTGRENTIRIRTIPFGRAHRCYSEHRDQFLSQRGEF